MTGAILKAMKQLVLAAALLGLVACPAPNRPESMVLGTLELPLSSLLPGSMKTLHPLATSLPNDLAVLTLVQAEDFVHTDGWRYLKNVFEVTNLSSSPWQNLTFYAYTQNLANQGGSAIKNLSNFIGNTSSNAQSVQPTQGMNQTPFEVESIQADFQAISRLEAIQNQARQMSLLGSNDSLLEYGFVARVAHDRRSILGTNCNPVANPNCNKGRVTMAYRIPNNQINNGYGFTATFVLVDENTTRVTRGVQESTSSVNARALHLAAKQVVFLGEDTDTSSLGNSQRLANLRIADGLNYLLPPAILYAVGDIAGCGANYKDEETATMLGALPGKILTLGDNVYSTGTTANYINCYEPSWGALKARTYPVIGNHDYDGSSNTDYLNYFADRAGSNGNARYRFEYGGWQILALDSNCSFVPCSAAGTQGQWLSENLAQSNFCTLAAWHHPRFSSSSAHGSDAKLTDFWQLLNNASADLVLSGHDHTFERLAPMKANGTLSDDGIRSFVVGTGGAPQYTFGTPVVGSEYRENSKYGALKLELYPSGMRWQFIATDNSQGDAGQMLCR